jgi:hypothetical protein
MPAGVLPACGRSGSSGGEMLTEPFTVLATVPDSEYTIIGDAEGKLGLLSGFGEADLKHPLKEALHQPGALTVMVLLPGSESYESIPVQKVPLDSSHYLLCGFGKRSREWVVSGDVVAVGEG